VKSIIAPLPQRLKPPKPPHKPNKILYTLQAAGKIFRSLFFFHCWLGHNGRQTFLSPLILMADSASTRSAPSELFEGAYYSVTDSEGFSIAKVLKLEPGIVHVRIYQQYFQQRPRSIVPGTLTVGTIHDRDRLGIGHLPLRLATFIDHEPIFLTHAEVKPEELEGYNLWKETADGSVFE
jgi:hypothetical protein